MRATMSVVATLGLIVLYLLAVSTGNASRLAVVTIQACSRLGSASFGRCSIRRLKTVWKTSAAA